MRGESAADPTNVIGYAPATPEYVWIDGKGLRIRAILYDDPKANKVYELARDDVLKRASAAFASDLEAEQRQEDGSMLITRITAVREAGPTLTPANDDARLLSVKSEDEAEREILKWDGPAAMRTCDTAAEFRQIAFELANDSAPDTAAHWALPHHPRPGAEADQGGVSAALGRLNQTGETVMSKDAIRRHLEAHQPAERAAAMYEAVGTTSNGRSNTSYTFTVPITEDMRVKAGKAISKANAAKIRQMRDYVNDLSNELLALIEDEEVPQEKSEGPNDWIRMKNAEFEEKDQSAPETV
jgi:hypothetical protein